jgi:zinc transport system substrate-binding protein
MCASIRSGVLLLILGILPAARGQPPDPNRDRKGADQAARSRSEMLHVAVSILPEAYFVERVGGDLVDVQVLVGPGQSPHTYDATPRQLEELSRAKVYFRIGVEFEDALLPRIEDMFQSLKVVDLREGIPLRTMSGDEAGAESEHAGRPDPHVWLSPVLVKKQAQTICDALLVLDPPHADRYRANLTAFQQDLERVHARVAAALAPLKGREVFVFHPAFGYFTDAYGLKQVPVEIEGKEPTARQLAALIARAKADGVKVIFVQPQFPVRAAEAVAQAIGGAVVPMDDLARDYLKNLQDMADKIVASGLGARP